MKILFKEPDAYKVGDIIISEAEIDNRLDELAQELVRKYKNKHLLIVGLLTGAAWFAVDLLKRLHMYGVTDAELTFLKVSSYEDSTTSLYDPRIEYDTLISPKGRNMLLIDDIVDTGKTLVAVT